MNRACLLLISLPFLFAGCASRGDLRETSPKRSATELLLLTEAARRAIDRLPEEVVKGRVVRVDATMVTQVEDEDALAHLVRRAVQKKGGKLAKEKRWAPETKTDKSKAIILPKKEVEVDLVLEVSGFTSMDVERTDFSTPEIPMPFTTGGVLVPAFPIYRVYVYYGRSVVTFVVRMSDGSKAPIVEECYGETYLRDRWIMLLGPFRKSDVRLSIPH